MSKSRFATIVQKMIYFNISGSNLHSFFRIYCGKRNLNELVFFDNITHQIKVVNVADIKINNIDNFVDSANRWNPFTLHINYTLKLFLNRSYGQLVKLLEPYNFNVPICKNGLYCFCKDKSVCESNLIDNGSFDVTMIEFEDVMLEEDNNHGFLIKNDT